MIGESKTTFNVKKMVETRKRKKISQKELAELSGLSLATIKSYEQGKYTPRPDSIRRICEALDVSEETITDFGFDTPLDFEIAWLKSGGGTHYSSPYGRQAAAMVAFEKLNEAGQRTAIDLLHLVGKVPEYKTAESPEDKTAESSPDNNPDT